MLVAHEIRVERGDRVLFSDLSLHADPGTVTHLTGRNGSGKTTLLRTLAGLITPDQGQIRWRDVSVEQSAAFRTDLNFIGHQTALNAELSGRENLHFLSVLLDRGAALDDAIARLDATPFADHPVRLLSAGQRQRLSLARLVLFKALLWMLDEPFTALDRTTRGLVESLIDEHVESGGIVLIATHQAFEISHPINLISLDSGRP